MTKRERVLAAIERRPVDRPPVAFWRHVPDVDHTSQGLADAMLAFHRAWDLDLIKVMSSGVYCVEDWGCKVAYQGHPGGAKRCTEHAVKRAADWARVRPLDPGAGALGRELEAVRLIRKGRSDDAPILMTIFSPFTIATKLAGDLALHSVEAAPDALRAALEIITGGRRSVLRDASGQRGHGERGGQRDVGSAVRAPGAGARSRRLDADPAASARPLGVLGCVDRAAGQRRQLARSPYGAEPRRCVTAIRRRRGRGAR
jgi:hypothetical protein